MKLNRLSIMYPIFQIRLNFWRIFRRKRVSGNIFGVKYYMGSQINSNRKLISRAVSLSFRSFVLSEGHLILFTAL
jgi:hypothetical protein